MKPVMSGDDSKNIRELLQYRLGPATWQLLEQLGSKAELLGMEVFLVGGIVRDLLLGLPNEDLDLTVTGDGIAFARSLAAELGGNVTGYDRFGTAAWQVNPQLKIDFVTARKEQYRRPGLLPDVEWSDLWDDLFRRDFTINALAVQLNPKKIGRMADYFSGREHLRQKKLKVLHDQSFRDDPTRIFRAVRFEGRLGFQMDETTAELAKSSARTVSSLSPARLTGELRLLFVEADPVVAVSRLAELGVWDVLLGQGAVDQGKIKALVELEKLLGYWVSRPVDRDQLPVGWEEQIVDRRLVKDRANQVPARSSCLFWLCYLVFLAYGQPGWVAKLESLALTKGERAMARQLEDLGRIWPEIGAGDSVTPGNFHRLLHSYSPEAIIIMIGISGVKGPEGSVEAAAKIMLDYLARRQNIKLPLTGKDLITLGLKPGPDFKQVFRELEAAVLDGELDDGVTEEQVLQWVEKYLGRD